MSEQIFEKKCTRCDETKPATLKFFGQRRMKGGGLRWDSWCKNCYRLNTRRHSALDPEAKHQRDKEYRISLGAAYNERRRELRRRQSLSEKQRRKEIARRANDKRKRQMMEHYGGAFCSCCGEDRLIMLAMDHVSGDGARHRREVGGSAQMYNWIHKNHYPPGIFRVLCHNCNFARHWNNGICPHEQESREIWQSFLIYVTPSGVNVSQPQAA